jgi:hypothetical protein
MDALKWVAEYSRFEDVLNRAIALLGSEKSEFARGLIKILEK